MTVTLDIPPDMEAVLSKKAELFGLDLPEYLFSLAEADVDEYYSLSVEDIESVQQGLAELAAGDRGISREKFDAQTMASREQRLRQQSAEAAA